MGAVTRQRTRREIILRAKQARTAHGVNLMRRRPKIVGGASIRPSWRAYT